MRKSKAQEPSAASGRDTAVAESAVDMPVVARTAHIDNMQGPFAVFVLFSFENQIEKQIAGGLSYLLHRRRRSSIVRNSLLLRRCLLLRVIGEWSPLHLGVLHLHLLKMLLLIRGIRWLLLRLRLHSIRGVWVHLSPWSTHLRQYGRHVVSVGRSGMWARSLSLLVGNRLLLCGQDGPVIALTWRSFKGAKDRPCRTKKRTKRVSDGR